MQTVPTDGVRGRGPFLLFTLLLAAFAGLVVAEHGLWHRVPDMIQASYMIGALDILDDGLEEPLVDLTPYGDDLGTRYYPPLILHGLARVFGVAGVAYSSVLWLVLPLALLALGGVFVAGAGRGDRWNGLLAALLLASYPGFRSASAGVYLDHALACLVAVALAAMVIHGIRGRLWGLAVFAVASAAAWMTRWTFVLLPAIALPTTVGELAFGAGARRRHALRLAGLLVASLVAVIPFAIWLGTRADTSALLGNVTAEPTRIPFLSQLVFYPRLMALEGTGIPLAVLALASLAHPAVWRSPRLRAALVLMIGGLVFLTWLPPKQPRYALVLYPSMALVTATAARSWGSPLVRRVLAGVLVIAALLTVGLDLGGRRTAHPEFLDRLVDRIHQEWTGDDPAHVLVHDRYYRLEGDLNAPVLIFVNAARGGGATRFVEGLFEPGLVHNEGCWGSTARYDFVILPVLQEHQRSFRGDQLVSCLDLDRLAVYDLREFAGEAGQITLYRVR